MFVVVSNMERQSQVKILQAIADDKSLEIFCSIAKGEAKSAKIKRTRGLSKKQFYWRTRQMMKSGLITRKKGVFSLTAFGMVVYGAEVEIEKALKNFWKLKAIDSIQSSGELGEQDCAKLIRTILNDEKIENILVPNS
jgi:predicted transcriptional regulator